MIFKAFQTSRPPVTRYVDMDVMERTREAKDELEEALLTFTYPVEYDGQTYANRDALRVHFEDLLMEQADAYIESVVDAIVEEAEGD